MVETCRELESYVYDLETAPWGDAVCTGTIVEAQRQWILEEISLRGVFDISEFTRSRLCPGPMLSPSICLSLAAYAS